MTTMPSLSAESEAQKRASLRKHKNIALAFLVGAAVIFFICKVFEARGYESFWLGLVEAGAEAGMVGGLADWFAVTALFRYPLGLRFIPHVAIIPHAKDKIGDELTQFIRSNFLTTDQILGKINEFDIPHQAGEWLRESENANKLSGYMGSFVLYAVNNINSDDAQAVIQHGVVEKLAEPEWGPLIGKAGRKLIADGHIEPLIDDLIEWAYGKVIDSGDFFAKITRDKLPNWTPSFVNEIATEKVHKEAIKWVAEIQADPNHDARIALRRFLNQLTEDLQTDPEMIAKVERIKNDIMASDSVVQAGATLWEAGVRTLTEAMEDPQSLVRIKIADFARSAGEKLIDDPMWRDAAHNYIQRVVGYVADRHMGDIISIISDQIRGWEAKEASEKIELMVGKDLQYIRINGTVVGALAGVVIYCVGYLILLLS
ncbi:uncharacterized membrane protein [Corynebacterium kutscheri]|uniref:Putative membrane protein n=1 Tax=Corynebacterium kutscheri TaxID=35755 RepID=A0A0F6TCX9_9CORY|nr:DUF445 family protein [Corynebacterium kutscheri]AKE40461.1 putative membrane protein [Corynebacterium kutscheri]VEH10855.1 uncharacterized membrane protein [Corynebacterium kutscheri]VEH80668.1 uncharacterized membrane protein [Corynebacterium kutscheri]